MRAYCVPQVARDFLEPVKAQFPAISYADLWILASYEAIEFMGGPHIEMKFGRTDATDEAACPPEHMLPDGFHHPGAETGPTSYDAPGQETADYVRWVFNKVTRSCACVPAGLPGPGSDWAMHCAPQMGFNDRQMVCLVGAHALGRCHTEASGYDGPWTNAPETFSNEYFRLMLEDTWTIRDWSGPVQYTNSKSGDNLMMLPPDIVLVEDPKFRPICEEYAADYDKFAAEFATNFKMLTGLHPIPQLLVSTRPSTLHGARACICA
jgi:cytochrome c peroxidase